MEHGNIGELEGNTKMAKPQIYEGTAEEIAEQLRKSKLSGRLKAIVTSENVFSQNGQSPNLADTLADYLAEVDQIDFVAGKPLSDPQAQEVSRLIARKFARQGHTK